jgi:hypothetical protein
MFVAVLSLDLGDGCATKEVSSSFVGWEACEDLETRGALRLFEMRVLTV